MQLDDALRPWLDPLRAAVPGLAPIDCHTHIGLNDPDGFHLDEGELVAALGRAGARGVVFPMHEPDGYPAANDRIRAAAERSAGRLVPFCRVDPAVDGAAEVTRSLDAGALGVKLHPRAESFSLSHPGVFELCAVAAERRAPVLVHAGRGIPALGRDALELAERFPSMPLILAHAGVSDLSWLWRHVPDRPNLHFDTAWWSPADLLALFALVPPGQILLGSDAPYGTPVQTLVMTLRFAFQVGLTAEQVRGVAGGQMESLLAGEPPADAGAAVGSGRLERDVLLDRVEALLAAAARRSMHGEVPDQELALARLACQVGEDAPQAAICRSILGLLDLVEQGIAERSGIAFQDPGAHLLVVAAAVARTPDVPLPVAEVREEPAAAATLPPSAKPD